MAESVGSKWNLTNHLRDAVEILDAYKGTSFYKNKNVAGFLYSINILSGKTVFDSWAPISIQLFLLLQECKKMDLVKRFKAYAHDAMNYSAESGAMEFAQISAEDSAKKNLGVNMNESKAELGARLRGGTKEDRGKAGEGSGKEKAESQEDKYRKELPLVASVESGVIHKTGDMTVIQAAMKWISDNILQQISLEFIP